ncbi:MAG: hypothetical protein LBR61_06425 [Synergistaceae bacterium]|jgi:hypothetical protein|nr:hypothetical protein [Synergistaceae bacterium]
MSEQWIDQSWKDVINENVDDAISFFMPSLAAKRDYSKEPEAINPEHTVIGGKSNKRKRTSDLCLSLPLVNSNVSRAIFLIEQQDRKAEELPLRIFQSYYRVSDKYAVPVTSLAIYTGKIRPVNTYYREWEGTSVRFRFNVYSVNGADAEELKRDERDFALAILAGKRMIEAKREASKRGAYSLELLDLIRTKNWSGEKAWSFRRFAYRLLQIDEADIDQKVKEAWKMEFKPISEVVRDIHIRDAREYGREEGKFEVARSMLADGVPAETVRKYTGLDESSIRSLK